MACFRSCFGSGAASRSVATMENPFGSASLLAVDLPPELELTAADQEAHKANSKLAEELMVVIANKLAELGICNFWRSPSSDHAHTQEQLLLKLPALSRCRCLQAIQARLDALPIPQDLKHRDMDPVGAAMQANAFRRVAEQLSEEVQLVTWRAAASQLFAVADPCQYVAAVGGEKGQQASLQLPRSVIKSMQELKLTQFPGWRWW